MSAACASAVAAEHALPGILRQAEPLRIAGPQPPPPRPWVTEPPRGGGEAEVGASLPPSLLLTQHAVPLCVPDPWVRARGGSAASEGQVCPSS